ncbi:MAG: hypothetical protein R6X02_24325 [Enhygromyxa sp.]
MNLKVRLDHLLLGLGAVVLLIGALLTWRALRPDPAQVELDEGLERLRSKQALHKPVRPRFIRPGAFPTRDRSEERQGWVEPPDPGIGDPGDLDADEAIDTFQMVLGELEAAADEGRKLNKVERAELYNRATGSFTALTAWTDSNNPDERALVDDAYARMMALMRELKIEPPQRDPDHNPLRR